METEKIAEPTKADYIDAIQQVAEASDRVIKATDVSEQSRYSVNEIVSVFGSWRDALQAAEVDNETRLLEELRRVGKELGHPPTTTEMNEHGHVSATMYADYFESFTKARKRAFPDEMGPQDQLDSNVHSSGGDPKEWGKTRTENKVDAKHQSSFISEADREESSSNVGGETTDSFATIAEITEDARLDQPIAVKICDIVNKSGDTKQVGLLVEDIEGDQCRLNIWHTHGIELTWQEGHWYVLEEARGKVWTNKRGQTERQLSSTGDLRVEHVGSDLPSRGDNGTNCHSKSKDETDTTPESAQEPPADEDESGTILGEVMSEFDDLSELEDS
jgi:hypothetical protein